MTRKSHITEIFELLLLYKENVNPIKNNFVLQIIADKILSVSEMKKLNKILNKINTRGKIFHELEVKLSNLESFKPQMTHDDFV